MRCASGVSVVVLDSLSMVIDNENLSRTPPLHPARSVSHVTHDTTFYLLTACSTVLLEKLTGSQLVKKFPAFYGTQRFITAFTEARYLSLYWASSIHSITPPPTSWRAVLILSFHLHLGLPSCLFPSDFPTKIVYKPHRTRWGSDKLCAL